MQDKSGIDPQFFDVFASWFNVDLIDLGSVQQVEEAVGATAGDLSIKLKTLKPLIIQLQEALNHWNSQIVMEFTNCTDLDWLFDNKTEMQLKEIVGKLIDALMHFQRRRV